MDKPRDILDPVAAITRIDAVPAFLKMLCDMSGMRFAAVTSLDDARSTVCAVHDEMSLGIEPGDLLRLLPQADAESPGLPIAVACPSSDGNDWNRPRWCGIETYASVPIFMSNQRRFGNLCALDSNPLNVGDPRVNSMFKQFAALIGAQLEQQLAREQERVAGELREQFIAILGHDLRNPLQAIAANSNRLERQLGNGQHLEIAAQIKTSVRRMSSMIDDVLDFARGRLGGGIGLHAMAVENLNAGLLAVVDELRHAHPNRIIIANVEVGRSAMCDLGRIQQVASNLLANALMHGEVDSPVKFTVGVNGEELLIEVWNSGDPIPTESLRRIFEPFWRHSASASRNGLGLGLHICAEIVRAHDGKISVVSTRDGGTRFAARFPLVSMAAAAPTTIYETDARAPESLATPYTADPGFDLSAEA